MVFSINIGINIRVISVISAIDLDVSQYYKDDIISGTSNPDTILPISQSAKFETMIVIHQKKKKNNCKHDVLA